MRALLADEWEHCRIERFVSRVHWWSNRRIGVFAAVTDGGGQHWHFARSAAFPIPSPTGLDSAVFYTLLAQLTEEGWEEFGPALYAMGYWHLTLRRVSRVSPSQAAPKRDEQHRVSPDTASEAPASLRGASSPPDTPPPGVPIRPGWDAESPPYFTLPPATPSPGQTARVRAWYLATW